MGQGYIFTGVCDSVHGGGDIPACLAAGLQGGSVARGVPGLGGGGLLPGEVPGLVGACSRGGGLSRPTPKGEIEGDQVQAHTQGGN